MAEWNRKIFALLLAEAKGVRSWLQFANDCDISYVQMRKLAQATQENPPRPKLIRKVAAHAFGEVDLEDLFFAAGIRMGEHRATREEVEGAGGMSKYRSLSLKDRRTVDRFIDFLLEDSRRASEEEHCGERD